MNVQPRLVLVVTSQSKRSFNPLCAQKLAPQRPQKTVLPLFPFFSSFLYFLWNSSLDGLLNFFFIFSATFLFTSSIATLQTIVVSVAIHRCGMRWCEMVFFVVLLLWLLQLLLSRQLRFQYRLISSDMWIYISHNMLSKIHTINYFSRLVSF